MEDLRATADEQKDLTYQCLILWKRCRQLEAAKRSLKKMQERAKSYSKKRSSSHGNTTAEEKVGNALVDIGNALGISVDKQINKHSVQHCMLEQGVAADIQLVYKILESDNITYNYSNPSAACKWKSHTMGIGTSTNHASQTQINGLKQFLNDSSLAKRESLWFIPDNFTYQLIGTSSDHAADQKKGHEILQIWRLEVILLCLGEEALFRMGVGCVLATLITIKAKEIQEYSGQATWDVLSKDKRAGTDFQIIWEIGKQVFDALLVAKQEEMTCFIWTGCCMHKDLNCVKGGAKSIADMWLKLGKTPPKILANKDPPYLLASTEKWEEEVSKWGEVHATTLDKKKGQQDTYLWYMEQHIGHCVLFPNMSNMQYGSHGETNLTYQHLPNSGFWLYTTSLSHDLSCNMSRSMNNILTLHEFFGKKASLLQSIIKAPSLWTGDQIWYQTGSLDGQEWDEWSLRLPDLDNAVTAFMQGAQETFFKEGGGIDKLTERELTTLYFSSTNDANKGGLGSWWHETLLKFNASFMATWNKMESFISHMLTEEEDHIYLMRTARKCDASRHQKALKEKITQNRKKEAEQEERHKNKVTALMETIESLKNNKLNLQLDCHHEIEKQCLAVDSGNDSVENTTEKVPLKSHMKAKPNRVCELKKAVTRFLAQGEMRETAKQMLGMENSTQTGDDNLYESDNDDL
ncbi:hypothetical protein L208DRAFT_1424012 [Tricholoma matsutake]|nr:hypothetical protein L208DRAFT_1424012 [Tricholoma matsutake 945]